MKKTLFRRILLTFLLVLTLTVLFALTAQAKEYGVYEGFNYFHENGKITITSYWINKSETSITVPATIDGKPVVAIDDYAFKEMKKLHTVQLPDSVERIGYQAFTLCTALKTVNFPKNLTYIGTEAFAGTALTEVTLPEGLKTVATYAFFECKALRTLTMPGITGMTGHAFKSCTALTTVTFLPGVATIPEETFWGCTSLREITLPEGLTQIGAYAFQNCSALKKITLPASVKNVNVSAFEGCSRLAEIYLECTSAAAMPKLNAQKLNAVPSTLKVFASFTGSGKWGGITVSKFCKDTHTFSAPVTQKEPTCKEEGEAWKICSVCGEKQSEPIPKLTDHAYGNWTVTMEPSGNKDGEKQRICSVCGAKETAPVSPSDAPVQPSTGTDLTPEEPGAQSTEPTDSPIPDSEEGTSLTRMLILGIAILGAVLAIAIVLIRKFNARP